MSCKNIFQSQILSLWGGPPQSITKLESFVICGFECGMSASCSYPQSDTPKLNQEEPSVFRVNLYVFSICILKIITAVQVKSQRLVENISEQTLTLYVLLRPIIQM